MQGQLFPPLPVEQVTFDSAVTGMKLRGFYSHIPCFVVQAGPDCDHLTFEKKHSV